MNRKKKNSAVKCKRCGRCCVVKIGNEWRACPYLLQYWDGKTRCMIYPHRIGVIVAPKQDCDYRENRAYNIPGCPYNKPGQPIHENYKNK